MGRNIQEKTFKAEDYEAFNRRIHNQVEQLKEVIARPSFGSGACQIGSEIEIYLINANNDVSPVSLELLKLLGDEQFQTELNKFNLEVNLSPVLAAGKPFSAMTSEILEKFSLLQKASKQLDTRPLAIGILPTLKAHQLDNKFMTDLERYKMLARELLKQRGEPFQIKIEGEESVDFLSSEVCVEGANTSLQVHLMVQPDRFANVFNAAQLTLPMALGISANSGVLLGKCLWDETRVVLFKQSTDSRIPDSTGWRQPARVTFGHGWVRKSAWELFAETVNLYAPILPHLFDADSQEETPELAELNLHMGTTWPWNRAIYSNEGKGHLRIEFRALPAGPSAIDMAANSAFSIGMAMGLEDRVDEYIARIPFQFAEYNFYRAAKNGLDATILWPQKFQNKPQQIPLRNVIEEMLQIADDGLAKLNVDREERLKYLGVIQKRLAYGITGASWQKQTLLHFRQSMSNEKACRKMLENYYRNQMSGAPISEWECCWK
ncbi:glutamate--cysteine ligase [Aliikangiella sp. IMCC44632]